MNPLHLPILLVEDNLDDIELTRRALAKSGAANPLVVAEEGDRALSMMRDEWAVSPALILLDLNLPGIPGRELLRQLRADPRWATVPIVVFSTSTQPTDIEASYRAGANSYHAKPADVHRYVQTVRDIVDYWLKSVVSASRADLVGRGARCYL